MGFGDEDFDLAYEEAAEKARARTEGPISEELRDVFNRFRDRQVWAPLNGDKPEVAWVVSAAGPVGDKPEGIIVRTRDGDKSPRAVSEHRIPLDEFIAANEGPA